MCITKKTWVMVLVFLFCLVDTFGSTGNKQDFAQVPSEQDGSRNVLLESRQGWMKGLTGRTQALNDFQSYEGIPYAKPPLNDLRFKDPVPAENWNGVLDATRPGPPCTQISTVTSDENCLTLNVYAPLMREPGELYPVMVYIHGGGFLEGGSSFFSNPELFIDERVVLVTVNYRLGPLGFLSLNTEEVPGNGGMKDQVAALTWVKNNIITFGGNADSVTIFGESAGGVSVLLHQLSEMSIGLFHKVISISGSSLCDWAIQEHPVQAYEELVNILQIDRDSLLKNLQEVPAVTIARAGENVVETVSGDFGNFPFRPIAEQTFPNIKAFLNMTPSAYYDNGYFSQIPVMMGYASKEFAVSYNTTDLPAALANPAFILPGRWFINSSNETLTRAIRRVKKFYFGAEELDYTDNEKLLSAVDLSSDLGFLKPVTEVAKIIARKSKEPTYLYRFSYRGGLSEPALDKFGIQGAAHGDEVAYIFPKEKVRVNESSSDGWVRRRLMKLYVNFARTGNPNPKEKDHLLPVKWLPVTRRNMNYLEISGELTMSNNPDAERAKFWRDLERFVLESSKLVKDTKKN